MKKIEPRIFYQSRDKEGSDNEHVVKDKDKDKSALAKNAIIVIIITAKLGTYVTLWHSSVTIVTVSEDVFAGGKEETDKPEVSSLPSLSP